MEDLVENICGIY